MPSETIEKVVIPLSENELSRKIRDLRALHGLTLEQVAQQVGVGRSTIRKWETGMIENMRRDKIAKLASALHTTPGYLMGWEETDKSSLVNEDEELTEYLQVLKTRPECRMLFQLSKDASKEDVEAAVRIIEALRKK